MSKHKKTLSEKYSFLMWAAIIFSIFPAVMGVTTLYVGGSTLEAVLWFMGTVMCWWMAVILQHAAFMAYARHLLLVEEFWNALAEEGCTLNAIQIDALMYSFPEYWTQNLDGDKIRERFYEEAYKMYVGLQQTDMARYLASFMWANRDLWYDKPNTH